MKWNNTILYFVLSIIRYKVLDLFRTNIRCWFGHNYQETSFPNVKKCKRCNCSTLFIKAIYEE